MSVRWLATAVSALLLLASCERRPAIEVLPGPPPADPLSQTFWPLPDFSLTERSGLPVTLADLRGKVWVADFFYTSCPGPCPMLSSRLSSLHEKLAGDDRVRLVSISADPEKDTPQVLQGYADRFHADGRWLFLTGAKPAIYDLAKSGFKVPIAEAQSAAEPIIHSDRLILVDPSGAVRGFYEGVGEDSTQRLLRDVRRLLPDPAMTVQDLPAVNASLNALSTVFICAGLACIKAERKLAHITCMVIALVTSTAFLACYLTYHYLKAGHVTHFTQSGWPRTFYFLILGTHTPLAVGVLPFIIMAVIRALQARYESHRRWAKWAAPIWLYVSVTGVLVYFMLYVWFPAVAVG